VLAFSAGTAGSAARSGLRGSVVIDPAYPVCKVGTPCTRPAGHVWLLFSRRSRTVARTRTADDGTYRIRLAPGTYRVTSPNDAAGRGLDPSRVTVRRGRYRQVVFKLDVGIR